MMGIIFKKHQKSNWKGNFLGLRGHFCWLRGYFCWLKWQYWWQLGHFWSLRGLFFDTPWQRAGVAPLSPLLFRRPWLKLGVVLVNYLFISKFVLTLAIFFKASVKTRAVQCPSAFRWGPLFLIFRDRECMRGLISHILAQDFLFPTCAESWFLAMLLID